MRSLLFRCALSGLSLTTAAACSRSDSQAPNAEAPAAPAPTSPFALPPELPEVVATVNGADVSREAFAHALRQLELQLQAAGGVDGLSAEDARKSALDRCIDDVLREQLATQLGVEADPEAEAAWLADLERRTKADPAFAAFLQQAGKDEAQQKRDARSTVLDRGIQRVILAEEQVELQAEARDYYERHPQDYLERAGTEVWRIYVKAPAGMMERDRAIAEARAEGIRAKALKAPEQFENLARESSDGGKGSRGGYLGFVPAGALPEKLYGLVRAAEPGTILPVWEDAAGYQILKVGKSREERKASFEAVEASIFERVLGPKLQRRLAERLSSLRAKAEVQVKDERLAQSAKPSTTSAAAAH